MDKKMLDAGIVLISAERFKQLEEIEAKSNELISNYRNYLTPNKKPGQFLQIEYNLVSNLFKAIHKYR